MALLPSWRGGLLLLFVDFRWHGLLVGQTILCPHLWRDASLGLFYGEKEGRIFWGSRPCGSRYPFRAPTQTASLGLPCSMPPVCGSRLGRMLWLPRSGLPRVATLPRSPGCSGPTPPPPGHPHRLLARAESLDPRRRPARGISAAPWPRRSRICLNAGSQPFAGPPSPEHPPYAPTSPGGVPKLRLTAKARNQPEQLRHCPAHRRNPRRTAKPLAATPHSEAPQPAPPRPSHPSAPAPRPGPQGQPAPTCSNSSNSNKHPTFIYCASNL